MKSQRAIFKWIAIPIILAVFVNSALVLPSASAQDEFTPTPTQVPTDITVEPAATDTPPESTPTESATPVPTPTEEDESAELAPPFVAGEVEPAFQLFSQSQPVGSGADNLLAGGDSLQSSSALVYNPVNREYLVVWVDDAAPATLRGRFTSEAAVPGGEEFVITHGIVSTPTRPEVVYNSVDNSYLLLWSELNGNTLGAPYYPEPAHNLYALKLANDGNPVSSSPTLISNQMGFFFTSGDITLAYAVAYNSNVNEFLVAWTQPTGAIIGNYRQAYRVMGQRLAPDGTLRAGQVTIKIGVFASIGLAYGPASNEYLLTWGQYFSGTSWDLFAQRLRADTLAVSGSTIGLGTGQGRQGVAALAYSPGTNDYFVTWMASPLNDSYWFDIVGRRVHAGSGALVGPLITILHDTDTVHYNDIAYSPVEDRFLVSGKLPTKQQFIGRYVTPLGEMPEETFQITALPLDNGQGTRADIPRIAARSGAADGVLNWVAAWKTYDDIYTRQIGYDCSGYEASLSPIGQAVFDKVESDQEFCGNQFEFDSLITLPPGEQAFQRFSDLAQEAQYEIDFTTMIWEEGSAGRIFLGGVKALYNLVQTNPEDYPNGIHVRILVGLQIYFENPATDQRAVIMREMDSLGIGPNDSKWTVDVAFYRDGQEFGNGKHSHVKTMIVDGKTVVVAGYNVQNNYLENNRRDMGVQVSGPIALRALRVFDELWMGAGRCDLSVLDYCLEESTITDTSHDPAILLPTITGNDVVFSLFRDDTNKTADNAIEAAINASNSSVNIFQNRFMNDFWYPPQYARAILNILEKGDGQVAVKLLVSGSDKYFLDDLALNTAGICVLKDQLLYEDPIGIHNLIARFSSGDKPIHTKALSIDGAFIIVGSQNFDRSAWGEDTGAYDDLGDLAEYSLGIDSEVAASDFNQKFNDELDPENGTIDITCPYNTFSQPPLQDAINQAPSGSVIFIPAGVYTESVTINKPLVLVGAGGNQTIIQPEGHEPAFRVTSSDVAIMNMKISGGTGYGIELIDSSPNSLKDIQIYRVVFENNAQGGVLTQGLIPGSPMNYAIENNTFIGGADGVTINMIETQAETSLIRDNIFSGQSEAPIDILSANDSRVEYSYNLFDDCDLGTCAIYWRFGQVSALSSEHDNLFDLDPLFSSPEYGAYQLSTGSPAIDAGDPSLLHDLYYDGDNNGTIQIDTGAFEYALVTNVPPIINTGDDQTIELGSSVTVNASYSDADNSEDHSARINWSDGIVEDVPTNMTGPGAGEVISQHTYASSGNYTIEICVIDINGGMGCDTISVTVTLTPTLVDRYLHGSGAIANPSTLFLDSIAPTSATAKYKDSTSVNFNGGNLWKDVGVWLAAPGQTRGQLTALNNLQVWLGLKNSDDQGTNFDLRVEVYKNNILVVSAESLCITGITRNPNLAKQVTLPFDTLLPADFNGTTDVFSLKIKTRIGTNDSGGMCGGHSNAVGLRLYFDASNRPSNFEGMFVP